MFDNVLCLTMGMKCFRFEIFIRSGVFQLNIENQFFPTSF